MSRVRNKVQLIGNVGQDPVITYLDGGYAHPFCHCPWVSFWRTTINKDNSRPVKWTDS